MEKPRSSIDDRGFWYILDAETRSWIPDYGFWHVSFMRTPQMPEKRGFWHLSEMENLIINRWPRLLTHVICGKNSVVNWRLSLQSNLYGEKLSCWLTTEFFHYKNCIIGWQLSFCHMLVSVPQSSIDNQDSSFYKC